MNILVCLKQTFDTEERISVKDGDVNEDDNVQWVINPYDEYAVEAAIQLKEEHGGVVTVITVGPERAEQALRTAMAMGADKGIRVADDVLGDEHTIAKVLAAAIQGLDYDIILGGYMTIDNGAAQVGPRLAEALGIPHISTITGLEVHGNEVKVEKDIEGDVAYMKASLPILLTAQQGLNEPRYPSLPGIMKAKRKPLDRIAMSDLNVDETDIAAKTESIEVFLPPKKSAGRILAGDLDDQVSELVAMLKNKKKVI